MNGDNYETNQAEQPQAAQIPPTPTLQKPSLRREDLPYKSQVLATVLSLMPGLGQIYVGYYQHGFIFLLVIAASIALLASGSLGGLVPLVGMFVPFFWIFNMVDANRRAAHYNRALSGLTDAEIPEDFQMPGARGSVPAGLILIVLGALILLDLNTDWSMEWVENWWPLVLVIFGGWLIFKTRGGSR